MLFVGLHRVSLSFLFKIRPQQTECKERQFSQPISLKIISHTKFMASINWILGKIEMLLSLWRMHLSQHTFNQNLRNGIFNLTDWHKAWLFKHKGESTDHILHEYKGDEANFPLAIYTKSVWRLLIQCCKGVKIWMSLFIEGLTCCLNIIMLVQLLHKIQEWYLCSWSIKYRWSFLTLGIFSYIEYNVKALI